MRKDIYNIKVKDEYVYPYLMDDPKEKDDLTGGELPEEDDEENNP